jgi:hypothetical protein
MASATVDRHQWRALQALRRGFGHDQVVVLGVRDHEPKGTTSPPRNPDRHHDPDQARR